MYEVPSCRSTQDVLLKTHYCNVLSLLCPPPLPLCSLLHGSRRLPSFFLRTLLLGLRSFPCTIPRSLITPAPLPKNPHAETSEQRPWAGKGQTRPRLPACRGTTDRLLELSCFRYHIISFFTVQYRYSTPLYGTWDNITGICHDDADAAPFVVMMWECGGGGGGE